MHDWLKIDKNWIQLFHSIDNFLCSYIKPSVRYHNNDFDLFCELKNLLDIKSIDYILLWSICIFKSWAIPIGFTIRIDTFIWNWCNWECTISYWDIIRSGVNCEFLIKLVIHYKQLISNNAVNSSALTSTRDAEHNVGLKTWS